MTELAEAIDREEPADLELSAAVRAELFAPAAWQTTLAKYALTTNLAVALTDAEGRLLGPILNPRPLWELLHAHKPAIVAGCPFSLLPAKPTSCIAEALAEDRRVLVRDRTGLVFFALPLRLGAQPLAALIAGQVFDQYPEQMLLEQVAKLFDLSANQVWQRARRENPVKQATLRVYGDLLADMGQTLLQNRYHALTEARRLAEMTRLRDRAVAEATERKRAEDALKEADRRKDEFLAMLAHELRNPLAPLRNALSVIRLNGAAQEGMLREARDVMERQLEQLVRLVDDLLDVSRITRGKVRLYPERVDMAAVVARAVEGSRLLMDRRRQTLEVRLPDEALPVDADVVRLAQVLLNLLNNAAKYTPEAGRITLTAQREGNAAVVRVRDTGMGIRADMLPRVFDLFTQADRTLDRSDGGLGIGLTLVRRLTEMHGGTVEASSAGPGQGSEFVVRLPLASGPAKDAEGRARPPAGAGSVWAHRVLIVDDNRDSADSLATLLRLFGHDVRTAYDGRQALALAGAYRPDVVFLDIGLPGMSGLEVCPRLREAAGQEHAVIVAMTGYGQEEDKRRSKEAGFNRHLVKPVDLRDVQELLASLDLACKG